MSCSLHCSEVIAQFAYPHCALVWLTQVKVCVTWEEGDAARFINCEFFGPDAPLPANQPSSQGGGAAHTTAAPTQSRPALVYRPPAAGITIVAAGGDGTINECAAALLVAGLLPHSNDALQGLRRHSGGNHELPDISLAVLPLGTSNDFAATCNIPKVGDEGGYWCVHPAGESWPDPRSLQA